MKRGEYQSVILMADSSTCVSHKASHFGFPTMTCHYVATLSYDTLYVHKCIVTVCYWSFRSHFCSPPDTRCDCTRYELLPRIPRIPRILPGFKLSTAGKLPDMLPRNQTGLYFSIPTYEHTTNSWEDSAQEAFAKYLNFKGAN